MSNTEILYVCIRANPYADKGWSYDVISNEDWHPEYSLQDNYRAFVCTTVVSQPKDSDILKLCEARIEEMKDKSIADKAAADNLIRDFESKLMTLLHIED